MGFGCCHPLSLRLSSSSLFPLHSNTATLPLQLLPKAKIPQLSLGLFISYQLNYLERVLEKGVQILGISIDCILEKQLFI